MAEPRAYALLKTQSMPKDQRRRTMDPDVQHTTTRRADAYIDYKSLETAKIYSLQD